VPAGSGGNLVLTRPWPAMSRTIWGDAERYFNTYWAKYPGKYLTGDGARRDEDGYFWLLGRVDDVVNVSGHRIGTMEIESALVSHPAVAEAAVIGVPDRYRGEIPKAVIALKPGMTVSEDELREFLGREISPLEMPKLFEFRTDLPKTAIGKINKRLMRQESLASQPEKETASHG